MRQDSAFWQAVYPSWTVTRKPGRVLLLGGAGFIGSNVASALVAKGPEVVVVDDCSSGQPEYLAGLPIVFRQGDVRDLDLVTAAMGGCDSLVYLAAMTSVRASVAAPEATISLNIQALVSCLKAAYEAGVGRFVFISSNAAVGQQPGAVSELSLPHPSSPYGASKLAGEAYCHAFAGSYGLETVVLRLANVYGPNSLHKESAVHRFIRSALVGRPITVLGDGKQTRDFIYVADVAQAIIAVLEHQHLLGETFQVGTGVESTVLEMVDAVASAVGVRLTIEYAPEQPGEIRRNYADVSKASEALAFRASTGLRDGIAKTSRWYAEQLATNQGSSIIAQAGD
jgi:UDP-glucose 4-epimerase